MSLPLTHKTEPRRVVIALGVAPSRPSTRRSIRSPLDIRSWCRVVVGLAGTRRHLPQRPASREPLNVPWGRGHWLPARRGGAINDRSVADDIHPALKMTGGALLPSVAYRGRSPMVDLVRTGR